jgi:tachykinin-like receptor
MQNFNDSALFNTTSYPWNLTTTYNDVWYNVWYDNDGYHNGSNYTDLEPRNQFVLPWWRQMIWTLLFACMITVATGGNLIVIWIVLAHRRMRTVTNYFLVNLSIADAMVSTLNVTFNYTYMLNSHWPFGTLYCKISQFIAVLTICASVFTLMAISIDR